MYTIELPSEALSGEQLHGNILWSWAWGLTAAISTYCFLGKPLLMQVRQDYWKTQASLGCGERLTETREVFTFISLLIKDYLKYVESTEKNKTNVWQALPEFSGSEQSAM